MRGEAACSPYRGLEPYTEEYREFFFGRRKEQELIGAHLATARLTVLFGASGVGKSSVLLAGVVPFLRTLPGVLAVVQREWQGRDFAADLRRRIAAAVAEYTGRPFAKAGEPLDALLKRAAEEADCRMAIILDQFEEYSLYHPPAETGETFDAELARAINRRDVEAHFLLSLREDSLAPLDRFQGRIPNLLSNYFRLEHLDRAGAIEAIREPLKSYERKYSEATWTVDAELEATLLGLTPGRFRFGRGEVRREEAAGEPDLRIETPFLQLVLTRIWEAEQDSGSQQLRQATLDALGGVESLVRSHLDEKLANLSPSQRLLCGRLFDRLVTPSGSKVALTLGDFNQYAGELAEEVPGLLHALEQARIVRPVETPEARRWEIYHDVLAAAVQDWWRRYRQEAAEREAERERGRARRFRLLAVGLSAVLLAALALFFWGWRAKRRAEMAEARAVQEAERAVRAGKETEETLGKLREAQALTAAEHKKADKARQAEERQLRTSMVLQLSAAAAAIPGGPQRSLALSLALHALGQTRSIEDRTVSQDVAARLRELVSIPREFAQRATIWHATFDPAGRWIAVTDSSESLSLWDLGTKQEIQRITDLPRPALEVAVKRDGSVIATSHDDGILRLWSANSGKLLRTLRCSPEGGSQPWRSTISPDWSRAAMAGEPGRVVVMDLGSGEVLQQLQVPAKRPGGIAYSPTGEVLAAAFDSTVFLWETGSYRLVASEPTPYWTTGVRRLTFSPDGRRLAASGVEGQRLDTSVGRLDASVGTARVWEVGLNTQGRSYLRLHQVGGESRIAKCTRYQPSGLSFSRDGNSLLITCPGESAQVWDLRSLRGSLVVEKAVSGLPAQYSGEQDLLVTGISGERISVRDSVSNRELLTVPPAEDGVENLAVNRDGSRFASGHADSRVRVWDTRRGQEIASLAVPTSRVAPILSIALSGDGRTLAAAEPGGTVVCWDMEKKEVIGRWAGQSYPARLGLDEAGRHLLVVGDTESELWSLAPGLKRIWQGEGGAGGALNPAGNRLAVTLGKVPRTEVRDIETGRLVHTLPATRQGYSSLLFSADGRHLATWSYEDGFQIWDMKTGAALAATQNIRVNFPSHVGLAFRPDGRALAINPGDAIWLWHWASGREERLVSRTTGLLPLSFSADGRRLLTAEKAGLRSGAFLQVREWLIEPDDLVQAARKQIDRPMTPEQCMQYFGRAQCPPLP